MIKFFVETWVICHKINTYGKIKQHTFLFSQKLAIMRIIVMHLNSKNLFSVILDITIFKSSLNLEINKFVA